MRIAALIVALLIAAAPAQAEAPTVQTRAKAALAKVPAGITVSAVLLDETGAVLFKHNATTAMPTASAIKAPIAAVLLARYKDKLDRSPKALQTILADPNHPALAHYSKKYRQEVRETLSGVTILRLAHIMIDSRDETGARVSNPVYNAATNLAIALIGGPEATTSSIRLLAPSFGALTVNRYMLANRHKTGDNTASAAAMAAFYHRAASNTLPGVDKATSDTLRAILLARDTPKRTIYAKGGALTSHPVASVRAGWVVMGKKRWVYAVMAQQDRDKDTTPRAQLKVLKDQTLNIFKALVPPSSP